MVSANWYVNVANDWLKIRIVWFAFDVCQSFQAIPRGFKSKLANLRISHATRFAYKSGFHWILLRVYEHVKSINSLIRWVQLVLVRETSWKAMHLLFHCFWSLQLISSHVLYTRYCVGDKVIKIMNNLLFIYQIYPQSTINIYFLLIFNLTELQRHCAKVATQNI